MRYTVFRDLGLRIVAGRVRCDLREGLGWVVAMVDAEILDQFIGIDLWMSVWKIVIVRCFRLTW